MSYVQTTNDPLYRVRYSELGCLGISAEAYRRPRSRPRFYIGPRFVPGERRPPRKPPRYGRGFVPFVAPGYIIPPIRRRRRPRPPRVRPRPGLKGLGFFPTSMIERVMEELKTRRTEPSALPVSLVEQLPEGFAKQMFEEIRERPTFVEDIVERLPEGFAKRMFEEVRERPTLVERVFEEVREQAFPIEIPGFEVDDTVIVPRPPRKEEIRSKTRSEVVSVPTEKADSKLAFELAEAQKYGYTHAAWMALGVGGRAEVRRAYPDGYKPVTPGGVPVDVATVEIIAGPDPLRQQVHDTGAGDHPGGLEFRTPDPNVALRRTSTGGLTFDDVLRVEPLLIQTAEERAGLLPTTTTQKMLTYGLMGVAAWILYDSFAKSKRPLRRPALSRSRARRRPRPRRRR